MYLRRIKSTTNWNSALLSALFPFVLIIIVSCSSATRTLFFDIPPPDPQKEAEAKAEVSSNAQQGAEASVSAVSTGSIPYNPADLEIDRPPIEEVMVWEEALELLPKDYKGGVDWAAALSEGTIKPRALEPTDRLVEFFKLDFFLKAKKPKYDAYFPHSKHLEWMGCDSCHPAVFKYRDNEISMKAIKKGEFCGACHGSVAFSAKNCKRCHLSK